MKQEMKKPTDQEKKELKISKKILDQKVEEKEKQVVDKKIIKK
jgi:hypothetical protein